MLEKFQELIVNLEKIKEFQQAGEKTEEERKLSNSTIKEASIMYLQTKDMKWLKLIFSIFEGRMIGAVASKIGSQQDREEALNSIKIGIYKMVQRESGSNTITNQVSYVNKIISNVIATKCTEIKRRKREAEILARGYPLREGEELVERYNKLERKNSKQTKKKFEKEKTGETVPPQFPEDNIERERKTPVDELINISTIPSDQSETEEDKDLQDFKNWQPEISPDLLRFFPNLDPSRSADEAAKTADDDTAIELTKKEYDKIKDPVTREIMCLRDKEISFKEIGELSFPELPLKKAEEKARNLYNYNKKKVVKSLKKKMIKSRRGDV